VPFVFVLQHTTQICAYTKKWKNKENVLTVDWQVGDNILEKIATSVYRAEKLVYYEDGEGELPRIVCICVRKYSVSDPSAQNLNSDISDKLKYQIKQRT
jgi:hypothetical protein